MAAARPPKSPGAGAKPPPKPRSGRPRGGPAGPRAALRPAGAKQGRPQGSPQRSGWRASKAAGPASARGARKRAQVAERGSRGEWPGGGRRLCCARVAAAGEPRLSGRSNASASAAGRVPDANGAKSSSGRKAQPGQTDPATLLQASIHFVRSAEGTGAAGVGVASGGCFIRFFCALRKKTSAAGHWAPCPQPMVFCRSYLAAAAAKIGFFALCAKKP